MWLFLKTMKRISFALLVATLIAMGQAQAATDPDNPSLELTNDRYSGIVSNYISKADYERALFYIDEGLKKNPLAVQLQFQRCVVYELMGEDAKARAAYETLIKTYPEIPEAYNNLAALTSKAGELDRAEELVKRAIMLRPNFALAHENLANLYLTRAKLSLKAAREAGSGSAAERLQALTEFLEKNPN